MKVLVTGATGFLGAHIVQNLLKEGHAVTVVDIQPAVNAPVVYDPQPDWIVADATDYEAMRAAVQRVSPEVVVHLVGMLQFGSMQNPFGAARVNVLSLANVLEAARHNKVRRVVAASSAAVYGAEKEHTSETGPVPHNVTLYGASKFFGEVLCRQYTANYGLETINLRYFLVYGPGEVRSPGMAKVIKDIESCVTGRNVEINSARADDRVHLVHVSDAARAACLAVSALTVKSAVYNIAGVPEDFVSLAEIAAKLKELVPGAGTVTFSGNGPYRSKGFFDISLAGEELGYFPEYAMEKGLKEDIVHILGTKQNNNTAG